MRNQRQHIEPYLHELPSLGPIGSHACSTVGLVQNDIASGEPLYFEQHHVVFLASDEASFITGAEFFVDGGFAQV
jgi:NAD(P)-dependent dehydrogenase (short-subunit alcohol dehydrogenase family)